MLENLEAPDGLSWNLLEAKFGGAHGPLKSAYGYVPVLQTQVNGRCVKCVWQTGLHGRQSTCRREKKTQKPTNSRVLNKLTEEFEYVWGHTNSISLPLHYRTRYRPGGGETIWLRPMAVRYKNHGGSTSIRGRVRGPRISGGWRWLSCRQPAYC